LPAISVAFFAEIKNTTSYAKSDRSRLKKELNLNILNLDWENLRIHIKETGFFIKIQGEAARSLEKTRFRSQPDK
jgi:hypothetical protein